MSHVLFITAAIINSNIAQSLYVCPAEKATCSLTGVVARKRHPKPTYLPFISSLDTVEAMCAIQIVHGILGGRKANLDAVLGYLTVV